MTDTAFVEILKLAFANGPMTIPLEVHKEDLRSYVKDPKKITDNDITGCLGEWFCVNYIFKGYSRKIPCIKYKDYRDIELVLAGNHFTFELKTHTPFFIRPNKTLEELSNTWNHFSSKTSIKDEKYYVGFWTLRHYGTSKWKCLATLDLNQVLFDLGYVLRMKDRQLIYVNTRVKERYEQAGFRLDYPIVDNCFSGDAVIYSNLQSVFR